MTTFTDWMNTPLVDRRPIPQILAEHEAARPRVGETKTVTPIPAAKPTPKVWTCAQLLDTTFPDPVWVVPDLLPAGLALLAGRPKLGKSWLALQLAVAVATGGRFLGKPIERGKALFIALEDSPRRLQGRLRDLGAPRDGLDVAFTWPSLAMPEGVTQLEAALQTYRLVCVDTLARAIQGPGVDWDSLGAVTAWLGPLQAAALAANACLLCIDHLRKPSVREADPIDDVLGTTAKTAVADVVWGLFRKRGQHTATLKADGRDIDAAETVIAFDGVTHCWQAADNEPTEAQKAILDALDNLGPQTVTALAAYLGKPHSNVSRELGELVNKGLVRSPSKRQGGTYELAIILSDDTT